jgi:hypothetical protein
MDKLIEQEPNVIMDAILNKWALKADDHIFRIVECEYYSWSDPYTHRHPKQKQVGTIYVHRSGKNMDSKYKSGTFKGMDITMNGGILIRSILDGTRTIEGPCNVVDHICNRMKWTCSQLEEQLEVMQYDWDRKEPIIGARVGLTLKRTPDDQLLEWARWLISPLRASTYVPTKHKETFFVVDIHRKDVPSRVKAKYQQEVENGKSMDLCKTMTQLEVSGYLSQL